MGLQKLLQEVREAAEEVVRAAGSHKSAALSVNAAERTLANRRRGFLIEYLRAPEAMGKTEIFREAWLQANTEAERAALDTAKDQLINACADLEIARTNFAAIKSIISAKFVYPEGNPEP